MAGMKYHQVFINKTKSIKIGHQILVILILKILTFHKPIKRLIKSRENMILLIEDKGSHSSVK